MKICKNKRLWAYTLGVHLLTLFSRCSCSVLTVSRSLVSCSRVALRSCWSLVAAWPRSLDSFFSFAKRSCSNNQEQTWHQWTKVKKKKHFERALHVFINRCILFLLYIIHICTSCSCLFIPCSISSQVTWLMTSLYSLLLHYSEPGDVFSFCTVWCVDCMTIKFLLLEAGPLSSWHTLQG